MSKTLSEDAGSDLYDDDEEPPTAAELVGGSVPDKGPDLSHIAPDLRSLARPLTDLISDPANARKHNKKNLDALAASLGSFQQVKNIVVQRKTDGTLIVRAGNGTLRAALALGWTHVAAVIQDWDDVTATAFGIADNRIAELAEWDDTLPQLLKALSDDGYEHLDAIGFDDDEIKKLVAAFESTDDSFLNQFGSNDDKGSGGEQIPGAPPSVLPPSSNKVILAFNLDAPDRDIVVSWLHQRMKEDGLQTIGDALVAVAKEDE